MTIGIDARMYKEGLGIGRYIEKLLHTLEQIESNDRFVIFLTKRQWHVYRPTSRRFTKVLADIPWYSWKEQLVFPFIVARQHVDLMHFPHFNVPLLYRGKMIVTIHDLIMLHQSRSSRSATTRGPLLHGIKYASYRFLLAWIAKHADTIITVSHAVESDLVHMLGISPSLIHVIYEACDIPLLPAANGVLPASVHTPFFLYAGNAYPHKNLENLLAAMKILSQQHKKLTLILCGQEDSFYHTLQKTIAQQGLWRYVQHLGFVTDDTLHALYTHARAVVLPSLQEGFGLPALEAQARGVPVAASRIPCLTEILGDSALFFDPCNPQDMARTLEHISSDEKLRYTLQHRGAENVRRFSWLTTAQQTYDLYSKN
ncbi:glycosyltransferase family 4 protein [Candidatus Uhrbacteria bacterium]|nr:glycosyltransferase family 4 protein [Candidatus Uhrbacteria bacterium]